MNLQGAVDDLYRIAVTQKSTQSPGRLAALAGYCAEQLSARGLAGASAEVPIKGWVRTKNWDVVWESGNRPRLAISLKSILNNLAGTVPNRSDDLIGEVADAQMRYPEIAIGYIIVMDVARDNPSGPGGKWVATMKERLARISGRRAPFWNQGTLEAALVVEVDFGSASRLLTTEQQMATFFDGLVTEVKTRL